jgi:putative FmdB family regulatory protein
LSSASRRPSTEDEEEDVPTYQYACTACGEKHEAVQAFTDAPLTECPACGGTLRKVFSAVGVVFKGSGFYKNDSRKSSSEGSGDGGSGEKKEKKEPAAEKSGAKSDSGSSSSDSGSAPTKKKDPAASKPTSTPAAKSA